MKRSLILSVVLSSGFLSSAEAARSQLYGLICGNKFGQRVYRYLKADFPRDQNLISADHYAMGNLRFSGDYQLKIDPLRNDSESYRACEIAPISSLSKSDDGGYSIWSDGNQILSLPEQDRIDFEDDLYRIHLMDETRMKAQVQALVTLYESEYKFLLFPELKPVTHGRCGEMALIAHRGLSGIYPESTLIAYEKAAELGASYLEGDIQRTKDGVLIVHHDDHFARVSDVGRVFPNKKNEGASAFTYKELLKLNFKGQKILTLEALIDLAVKHKNRPGLYLETKNPESYPGIEKQIFELLKKKAALAEGKIIYQSFSRESLERFQEVDPVTPRVLLIDGKITDLSRLRGEGLSGIGPDYQMNRGADLSSLMTTAASAGLFMHMYTVDEGQDLSALIDLKAQGVFTNRIDRLIELCQ